MPRSPRHILPFTALTVLVALGVASCLAAAPVRDEARKPRAPDCSEMLENSNVPIASDRAQSPLRATMTVRTQVLLLVCNERVAAADTAQAEIFATHHLEYPDRQGDPLQAGIIVVACMRSEACYRRLVPAPGVVDPIFSEQYHIRDAKAALGMVSWYASAVSRTKLRASLEQVAISPQARHIFESLFADAAGRMAERIAHYSPTERRIFVDIPHEVRRERAEYFRDNASLYQRFEVITRSFRGPERIRELHTLRSEYVANCRGWPCFFDPFYVEVSIETARSCVVVEDVSCAVAESDALRESRANRNAYGLAIYRAQRNALQAANDRFSREEEARRGGVDESTIRAAQPKAPGESRGMDYSVGRLWRISDEVSNVAALLSQDSIVHESGTVKSIRTHGDLARVDFKPIATSFDDPYDCVRTGYVSRTRPDGTLEYEERCKWRTVHRESEPAEPIFVPKDEAKLAPGDLLSFVAEREGRRARVVTARRDGNLVQQRGDRIDSDASSR